MKLNVPWIRDDFAVNLGLPMHIKNPLLNKSLYMYNRDKSILYYYTNNVIEYLCSVKLHKDTYIKHLNNGTYYLGKYKFTRELDSKVKVFKEMSLSEVVLMLDKDRKKQIKKIK